MHVNDKFFMDNPLKKNSTAEVIANQIVMGLDDDFNEKFRESVLSELPDERKKSAEDEKNAILAAETPEEIISFMRRHKELVNRPYIFKKALEHKNEVLPETADMYIRNSTERFLETAAALLYHADYNYAEEVLLRYDEIVSPYAKALVCLLIGLKYSDSFDDFLFEEYKSMSFFFPESGYEQFPLLALYMIHEKY